MNQHINSKNIVSEYNSIISSFSDNWNGNYKNLSKFLINLKLVAQLISILLILISMIGQICLQVLRF